MESEAPPRRRGPPVGGVPLPYFQPPRIIGRPLPEVIRDDPPPRGTPLAWRQRDSGYHGPPPPAPHGRHSMEPVRPPSPPLSTTTEETSSDVATSATSGRGRYHRLNHHHGSSNSDRIPQERRPPVMNHVQRHPGGGPPPNAVYGGSVQSGRISHHSVSPPPAYNGNSHHDHPVILPGHGRRGRRGSSGTLRSTQSVPAINLAGRELPHPPWLGPPEPCPVHGHGSVHPTPGDFRPMPIRRAGSMFDMRLIGAPTPTPLPGMYPGYPHPYHPHHQPFPPHPNAYPLLALHHHPPPAPPPPPPPAPHFGYPPVHHSHPPVFEHKPHFGSIRSLKSVPKTSSTPVPAIHHPNYCHSPTGIHYPQTSHPQGMSLPPMPPPHLLPPGVMSRSAPNGRNDHLISSKMKGHGQNGCLPPPIPPPQLLGGKDFDHNRHRKHGKMHCCRGPLPLVWFIIIVVTVGVIVGVILGSILG